jgi:NAD-dependent dihydropyrimidine dehydrogenase PreA subunit
VEGPWVDGKPHGLCIIEAEGYRGVGTFTHGHLHGGPCWLQGISSGRRYTYESFSHGHPVGIRREYCSDKESCIFNDKKSETATPGWMFYMRQDESKDVALGKYFIYDGSIEQGDMYHDG